MTEEIQLYSLATPNGRKVSIALEEMELPYKAFKIDIQKGEQHAREFLLINPNGKIPAIVDPNGPDGKPLAIMESGAILIYLAEKSGKFLSEDPRTRNETLQWLFFQVGHIGPMFGQFGHFFKYAKDNCPHPYPTERYAKETQRLLGVLEERLKGRDFLVGEEYSIADMATFPWVGALDWGYEAREYLNADLYRNVWEWHDRCMERPKTQAGSQVCPLD